MRQTQQQSAVQKLALTMQMRGSLDLLRKGPDEVAEEVEKEVRRNPFLRYVPAMPSRSGARQDSVVEAAARSETRTEALSRQISLIRLAPEERQLADMLLYCLDDRGFLSDPADQMCRYLDVRPSRLAAVVTKLQNSVDPPGLFAWSLKDSFRIQLAARSRCDPSMLRLLDHLDLVARQDIPGICLLCSVDREDARGMVNDVRTLNPAPMVNDAAPSVVPGLPELVFTVDDAGAGTAELNPDALPSLLTDDGLFQTVATVETEGDALAYYRDCYRGAGVIVQAMQKRANTLLRIGRAMVDRQARFVRSGRSQDRKPLTMGELAGLLDLNKSTISRALNQCSVETPHGVMPASVFFIRPLSDADPRRTREQALRRLSVILRTEDRKRPFSDEALAGQLAKARFTVNRRTIANYRAILGVPGAYERRIRDRT